MILNIQGSIPADVAPAEVTAFIADAAAYVATTMYAELVEENKITF
jgi:hypothetical protein